MKNMGSRAAASVILQEAQQQSETLARERERDLTEASEQVERMLARGREKASDLLQETRQKCDSLQQDAERRKAEISEEVEEIREQLHFLNLQKQQFLRAAVSMLIDFGQVVDKAQQEFELEMAGKMEDLEAEDSTDSKEDAPAEEVVDQSESSSEAEADPINALAVGGEGDVA